MSSPVFIQKHIVANDGTNLAYRVYPGRKESSVVVFVHGLFGSALLFHPIASVLSVRQIPSISVDLRGFWASGQGNVTLEAFSDDLLVILTKEWLVKERHHSYRCTRSILLVGYSMGTLVTSMLKKRITDTDGGTRAIVSKTENMQNPEEAGDMTLFHVSPILALQKRRMLRHFLLPEIGQLDLRILAHPFDFFRLVWEILSARRFIELTGYVVSGFWDFCFYREMANMEEDSPYTLRVFEREDHYLLYRVPQMLANYLLQVIIQRKEGIKSPPVAESVGSIAPLACQKGFSGQ